MKDIRCRLGWHAWPTELPRTVQPPFQVPPSDAALVACSSATAGSVLTQNPRFHQTLSLVVGDDRHVSRQAARSRSPASVTGGNPARAAAMVTASSALASE